MPTASLELSAQWPGGDKEAITHLESRGYKLCKDWSWTAPKSLTKPTTKDWSAISYLVDEWDFGPLTTTGLDDSESVNVPD